MTSFLPSHVYSTNDIEAKQIRAKIEQSKTDSEDHKKSLIELELN